MFVPGFDCDSSGGRTGCSFEVSRSPLRCRLHTESRHAELGPSAGAADRGAVRHELRVLRRACGPEQLHPGGGRQTVLSRGSERFSGLIKRIPPMDNALPPSNMEVQEVTKGPQCTPPTNMEVHKAPFREESSLSTRGLCTSRLVGGKVAHFFGNQSLLQTRRQAHSRGQAFRFNFSSVHSDCHG